MFWVGFGLGLVAGAVIAAFVWNWAVARKQADEATDVYYLSPKTRARLRALREEDWG